ncbi:hypothetical protein GmHk_16G045555 [Glycine max]|nr:hypothetical protein GmHk_16G045555 [Glycine max]
MSWFLESLNRITTEVAVDTALPQHGGFVVTAIVDVSTTASELQLWLIPQRQSFLCQCNCITTAIAAASIIFLHNFPQQQGS